MFVPLSHRPGQAQADFGQADAYIAGKKVRFYYFCGNKINHRIVTNFE